MILPVMKLARSEGAKEWACNFFGSGGAAERNHRESHFLSAAFRFQHGFDMSGVNPAGCDAIYENYGERAPWQAFREADDAAFLAP